MGTGWKEILYIITAFISLNLYNNENGMWYNTAYNYVEPSL
jgi:hypothetical protein